MELPIIALLLAGFLVILGFVCLYADFLWWLVTGRQPLSAVRCWSDKLMIFVLPFMLILDYSSYWPNSWDWTEFLPLGQMAYALLGFVCIAAYFYSVLRTRLGPALLEITINYLLFIAILLTGLMGIHENAWPTWIFCTIPLLMLLILTLADNYRLAREGLREIAPPVEIVPPVGIAPPADTEPPYAPPGPA